MTDEYAGLSDHDEFEEEEELDGHDDDFKQCQHCGYYDCECTDEV